MEEEGGSNRHRPAAWALCMSCMRYAYIAARADTDMVIALGWMWSRRLGGARTSRCGVTLHAIVSFVYIFIHFRFLRFPGCMEAKHAVTVDY